jgi:2-acetylphloroglucinol acetyltransferase
MRRVAIVGVGTTPRNQEYMRLSDHKSWKDYVFEAAYAAIDNVKKGLAPRDLQYAVVNYHGETYFEGGGIGPHIADLLGMHPMGVTALCANCTGAGVSLHDAFGLVASGRYDRVLVIGFEKRMDVLNTGDTRVLGGDVDYDYSFGYDHPTIQALLQSYAYKKYGIKKVLKALASYRMQSVWWGTRNPLAARWGRKYDVTVEELHHLIDTMPKGGEIPQQFWAKLPTNYNLEGASAIILVPADEARAYTDKPVYLDGIAYKCNSHLLSSQMYYPVPELANFDMCDFGSTHVAADEAYKMAGIAPTDVEFAELFESHITSLVPTLAATRVPDPDKVLEFIIDEQTGPDGRLPTGTDGGGGGFGLTSGGDFSNHVFEAVLQMRGEAGARQLKRTGVAVISGMQGEMASSAVAVLRNS